MFPSLFEEQIEHEELNQAWLYEFGTESFAESLTYLPELNDYNVGTEEVPASARGGSPRGIDSGHRQPQRRLERRVDALRPSAIQDAGADAPSS